MCICITCEDKAVSNVTNLGMKIFSIRKQRRYKIKITHTHTQVGNASQNQNKALIGPLWRMRGKEFIILRNGQ